MPPKLSLKIEYKSPFVTLLMFVNQKGYRTAWMLNKHLDFELERIRDFEYFIDDNEAAFGLYKYFCNKYRMNFFLLENKNEKGAIINSKPAPDYLLLIWNKSDFFDIDSFIKTLKKNSALQAVVCLDAKMEQKHQAFFHDLEFFLEGNEEI